MITGAPAPSPTFLGGGAGFVALPLGSGAGSTSGVSWFLSRARLRRRLPPQCVFRRSCSGGCWQAASGVRTFYLLVASHLGAGLGSECLDKRTSYLVVASP